jgi:hypothetical protein
MLNVQAHRDLGGLAPLCLEGITEQWWDDQSIIDQVAFSKDWDMFVHALTNFFCHSNWLNEQQRIAAEMKFRDSGNNSEKPYEFFIRKRRHLQFSYPEITDGLFLSYWWTAVPHEWKVYLHGDAIFTARDLEKKVKQEEDSLMAEYRRSREGRARYQELKDRQTNRMTSGQRGPPRVRSDQLDRYRTRNAKAAEVEAEAMALHRQQRRTTPNRPPKKYSKDKPQGMIPSKPIAPPRDDIYSKPNTPRTKGGYPCKWCGSSNHFNNDCPVGKDKKKVAELMNKNPNVYMVNSINEEGTQEEEEEEENDDDLPELEDIEESDPEMEDPMDEVPTDESGN